MGFARAGVLDGMSSREACGFLFFSSLWFGLLSVVPLFSQTATLPSARAHFRTLPNLADVRLSGELGTRYQAATCNVLTHKDRYSLESFRADALGERGPLWWDWPGDQIGRYLSVLHVARLTGWTPASAERDDILNAVLPGQRQGGNFGLENPDIKDVKVISGNAFALRGLLDAYEDSGDRRALAAARRLAKFFEVQFDYYKDRGPQGSMHEFYGHCLDGLVRLYELGGDAWVLDLAQRIASRTGLTAHTHHSLSMYRGVMDFYRLSGNEDYLKRTLAYLNWVRSIRAVTGGMPESMPSYHEDEGCALSDYVVVNLQVFAATGRDEYLDEAENTLVNHFAMNQFHTGGFGHRSYTQEIVGGKDWQGWGGKFGSENPGCCSMWGQWGLANVGQYIVSEYEGAIEVNLYPDAEISLPGRGIRIVMHGDYPRMRETYLTIYSKGPMTFDLHLRVPKWAQSVRVSVNARKAAPKQMGRRLVLHRTWRFGDRVKVQFESPFRLVHWPKEDSLTAAIFDGPLCLALSSVDSKVDGDWKVAVTKDGKLALDSSGQPVVQSGTGEAAGPLRPIGEDWLSPELSNPHRLRVLFKATLVQAGR